MPPVLDRARDLLAHYQVLFCDVWGVVHDGRQAYVESCAALIEFRDRGGTVILVSNAPRMPDAVQRVLGEKRVPEACWDAIVSSGAIARRHAASCAFQKIHHIGPDRDLDIFADSGLERVELEASQAIFCTGLIRDREETGDTYRPLLERALVRDLPLICANPDLVVDVGGTMLPCAGAIAAVYEEIGGEVYWAGKPHGPVYEHAHALAENLRGGGTIARSEILAIGDAQRTDIAGAASYGIDSIFIAQGIHRDEIMPDGSISELHLNTLFSDDAPQPIGAMTTLRW